MRNPFKKSVKPVLYHYCVMRNIAPGQVQFFHGSTERFPPLATNDDYTDFSERLIASLKCPKAELIIVSLNRL